MSKSIYTSVGALAMLATACAAADAGGVSGRLEAETVVVSAEASGRVLAVEAREGATLAAGDVLLRLDCADAEAQAQASAARVRGADARLALLDAGARDEDRAAAEARLQAAEARLRLAQSGATSSQIAQIDAALEGVAARLSAADAEMQRAAALLEAGGASGARAERARAERDALAAERDRLTAQRAEARAGARREERAIFERQVDEARAMLESVNAGARDPERDALVADRDALAAAEVAAQLSVARCVVVTPVAGRVDIMTVEPGEQIARGGPVAVMVPAGPLELLTWAPQTWLDDLAVGDVLIAKLDGVEGELRAEVHAIAEEAEFTGTNVQTPTDRARLVYRVDATVVDAGSHTLRAGMTATVAPPSADE